jgi:lipopolysaccharide/colanic/teichoic acid biosynthesis glycosyltransferase
MHVNHEAILKGMGLNNLGEDGRLLVFDNDPRIGKVGQCLRKFSIDELPQLWNVLWGDMSLIGPRPLPLAMLQDFPEVRAMRSGVRPGISGLWQVRHRTKNASVLDMVDDDLEYIRNFSLRLDLEIALATLPRIIEPSPRKSSPTTES